MEGHARSDGTADNEGSGQALWGTAFRPLWGGESHTLVYPNCSVSNTIPLSLWQCPNTPKISNGNFKVDTISVVLSKGEYDKVGGCVRFQEDREKMLHFHLTDF